MLTCNKDVCIKPEVVFDSYRGPKQRIHYVCIYLSYRYMFVLYNQYLKLRWTIKIVFICICITS